MAACDRRWVFGLKVTAVPATVNTRPREDGETFRAPAGESAMGARWLTGMLCLGVTALAAWLGGRDAGKQPALWKQVAPGVWRSAGEPSAYALVDGDAALLIDAAAGADGAKPPGINKVERVLLTHHHRDSCAGAA